MYDSVGLVVSAPGALETVPCYIDDVAEHYYNGVAVVTGHLGNLGVTVSADRVKVQHSLARWYLGNNGKSMTRRDVQHAVEALSDTLHLPMHTATVTRLDVATNLMMQHPVGVYLEHLGEMKGAKRLLQPDALYYTTRGGCLTIYDKVKEQRARSEPVPEIFQGRSVLRMERRYTKRVQHQLGQEVTGASLYNEAFYTMAIDRWRDAYRSITKIRQITIDFTTMTGKKQFYRLAALHLIESQGGQLEFLGKLSEAQKMGQLTSKQAYDLRQAVDEVCNCTTDGLTTATPLITELDRKVNEAVRYYR